VASVLPQAQRFLIDSRTHMVDAAATAPVLVRFFGDARIGGV
jgi:hypothetical protein